MSEVSSYTWRILCKRRNLLFENSTYALPEPFFCGQGLGAANQIPSPVFGKKMVQGWRRDIVKPTQEMMITDVSLHSLYRDNLNGVSSGCIYSPMMVVLLVQAVTCVKWKWWAVFLAIEFLTWFCIPCKDSVVPKVEVQFMCLHYIRLTCLVWSVLTILYTWRPQLPPSPNPRYGMFTSPVLLSSQYSITFPLKENNFSVQLP